METLPYSLRVLLEACLRNVDNFVVNESDVIDLAIGMPVPKQVEVPFKLGRVVLQDFTGVPAVVDLAALRTAMVSVGGDPEKNQSAVPCDLVIDHSVQVDRFGDDAVAGGQRRDGIPAQYGTLPVPALGPEGLRQFPRCAPATVGIVHQVNLEFLAKVVFCSKAIGPVAVPDTLVGTDSHTTMINGLGVLGWGVGGIEAEAVMLGHRFSCSCPRSSASSLPANCRQAPPPPTWC